MSPLYKNISSIRQEIAGKVIEPGTQIKSCIYYNENDVGLLRTSDLPSYNPTILSEKIRKSGVIEVPKFDNLGNWISKYSIHLYVEDGEAIVSFNIEKNEPLLYLYKGIKWNLRFFERLVEKMYIYSDDPFLLYITIEKF